MAQIFSWRMPRQRASAVKAAYAAGRIVEGVMHVKKLHLIVVVGLLAPSVAIGQSADGLSTSDEWRAHFHELCLTGEAGLVANSSMFGIAERIGAYAARAYCDCFADAAIDFYEERGIELGMGGRFKNAAGSGDRLCYQRFDDGGPRFDVRTVSHDKRQAILEAVAQP